MGADGDAEAPAGKHALSVHIQKGFPGGFELAAEFAAAAGITILFGRSGSGKTTILSCVAGLLAPDAGRIAVGSRVLFDREQRLDVPVVRRNVGYVFQDLALFPHLTAEQNVAYGLGRLAAGERRRQVQAMLEQFRIAHLAGRKPAELSGGERQRVALARSLVIEPQVLLLDEPLAALDLPTQSQLIADLRRWNREHQIPILYVTHSQREVFALGERVVVHHHVPCGDCYYCRKQTPTQCELYKKVGVTAGFEPSGGGFAEYIRVMDWIVDGRGVVRIPDGVPFEQAAFVEPLNTVLKGVKLLNLAADDSVLVIGQGPIGLMHAALARRTGARVLTSDLYPERHAIAARFGLKDPIDAGRENVVERVFAATDGRGADAVILAVGGNALIKTAMDAVRPGGRVMLFAQTQHGEVVIDPGAVCMDEKTLMGSYSSSFEVLDEVTGLAFGGFRNGFDLTQLISHRFSLEQAVEAIEVASHPKADSMKIMLEPVAGGGAE